MWVVTFAWFQKFIGYFTERGDWRLGIYVQETSHFHSLIKLLSTFKEPDSILDPEFYSSKQNRSLQEIYIPVRETNNKIIPLSVVRAIKREKPGQTGNSECGSCCLILDRWKRPLRMVMCGEGRSHADAREEEQYVQTLLFGLFQQQEVYLAEDEFMSVIKSGTVGAGQIKGKMRISHFTPGCYRSLYRHMCHALSCL